MHLRVVDCGKAVRVCVLFSLALVIGCSNGPSLGEVTGKVTYGGAPVANAAIEFHPVGPGKHSVGYSDAEGEYFMQYTLSKPGALVGKHTVTVRVYPEAGQKAVPVPGKFGAASTVEFEVGAGDNVFDIELKE